jgi:hypothetical protein
MVTLVFAVTAVVLSVKVPVRLPAGIVTVDPPATVTPLLFVVTVTGSPPLGACAFSVMIPVMVLPPTTFVEGKVTCCSHGFTTSG